MKKHSIKTLLILFCSFSSLMTNPIMTPDAYLSEIHIDEVGNWEIELYSEIFNSYGGPWYSKFSIETNSGRANITYLDSAEEYIRITNDNLDSNLSINSLSDSVKLLAHRGDPSHPFSIDYVVLGEENGSYIKYIKQDQSVSRIISEYFEMMFGDLFYKSDSCTIGYQNDTSNAKGVIYGYAFGYDGSILANRRIWFEDGLHEKCETDENGYYCARLLSRSYVLDSLWVQDLLDDSGENMVFSSLYFDLEVGDSLRVDFHQLETSIIPVIKVHSIKFNNYPHPASNYTWFVIDNTDIEASAMRVNVYALNGRKVDSFIPSAYQCRYDCSKLAQGSYIMTLQHGREVLATKKLQILK